MSLWKKIKPKGLRFSMTGSVMLLFTGMVAYLAVRFPRFMGLKVALAIFLLLNLAFFIRWREKGPTLVDRIMESRFFPRKLTLSKEGKFLFIICVGVGFAAVNTGGNLLYLLFAMSLSIIVASGILSELSLRGVRLECEAMPEVVAGLPAHVPMLLQNGKGRFNSFSLEGSLLFEGGEVEQTPGFIQRVGPGQWGQVAARLIFTRRGIFRVRGFRISTSYPFSFFTKGLNVERTEVMTVLPRGDEGVGGEVLLLARGAEEEDVERTGRGGEFYSARPMAPGDDWRDVYWKGTARSGKYMVKEYHGLTGRRVLLELLWDGAIPDLVSKPGRRGRKRGAGLSDPERQQLEGAVEVAASVARQLLIWGYDVGATAPHGWVAPSGGEAGLRPVLRLLATFGYAGVASLPDSPAATVAPAEALSAVRAIVRVNLRTGELSVVEGASLVAAAGGGA